MGAPSYLLKRHDTYYFRQACDPYLKSKVGKREIVRSLGVKDKSVAVRMAREFKVNLDYVIDNLNVDSAVNPEKAGYYIDSCFLEIKKKYDSFNANKIINSSPCFSQASSLQPPVLQSKAIDVAEPSSTAAAGSCMAASMILPVLSGHPVKLL